MKRKKNNELNQIESPTVAPATITIKRDKRSNNNNFNAKANMKKKTRQIWLRCTVELVHAFTNEEYKQQHERRKKNAMYFMP